ncbi:MAG: arginine--tRNA ligase [Vicinamibacteria bacterium]|nr:arginine--tRNA ligase [Vicinamibacteria bacterium]
MILAFQSDLAGRIRQTVAEAFGVTLDEILVQTTPKLDLGDMALPLAFDLAKKVGRKPRDIAQELAPRLGNIDGIDHAEVAGGGFINLFLDRSAFTASVSSFILSPPAKVLRDGRVIVEHTSINPNKAAHIGHVRNSILGDTFVRLLQARGHEVLTQNYIDDTGVQVADVIVGFEQLEKKSLADIQAIPDRLDYYCWDLYARVFEWYGGDKERKALQVGTLHAIEKHEGPTAELGAYVAARIVRAHIATMARLDIGYDLLVRESDILQQHFWARAFELLKEKKAIEFEEEGKAKGCWVLRMDEAEGGGEENKIIVRSNGTVTYTGKDIAYQLWKLGKLGLDFRYRRHEDSTTARPLWSSTGDHVDEGAPPFGAGASLVFNVIDVGQSYPQRVVKAGVEALAGREAAEGTRHLGYEKVVLSKATARELGYEVDEDAGAVKVSGRRGLGVKADDLLDALEAKASNEIATRDPERSLADRTKAAHDIAVGALRYFMLRFSRNRIITFDMEEALAFTGETGPYIQNSVVRARSILAKVASEGHDVEALLKRAHERSLLDPWLATAEGGSAWSLFLAMARTDEAIETAVRTEEPSVMTRHAFQIAQAFHGYYQNPAHSVVRAESEDLRAVRVLVVQLFVRHTTDIAGLLGIPIPDRM